MSVLGDAVEELERTWLNRELEVKDGDLPAWRGRLDSAVTRSDNAVGGEVAILRFDSGRRELRLVARDTGAISFVAAELGGQPRHLRVLRDDGTVTIALASDPIRALSAVPSRLDAAIEQGAALRKARAAENRPRFLAVLPALLMADDATAKRTSPGERRPPGYPIVSPETRDLGRLQSVTVSRDGVQIAFDAVTWNMDFGGADLDISDSEIRFRSGPDSVLVISLPSGWRGTLTGEGDAAGVAETTGVAA